MYFYTVIALLVFSVAINKTIVSLSIRLSGSGESLGLQDQTSQSLKKSTLNIYWKDCGWSWNSSTLATWCLEPTHWKRSWHWERLRVGGEAGGRGRDGWMASLTQWTQIWANSGRCEGRGGLVSCRPWGLRELDTTYRLNNGINSSFPFSQRLPSWDIPPHLPVSASRRDSIGNLCALVYLSFLLTSRTGSLQTTFFRLHYQPNAA